MGGACSVFEKERGVYRVLVGNPEERDHWGDPGVDERITLRRIFGKWGVGIWTGLIWLSLETCGGHL
jgi:hypothetical protein